MVMVFFQERNKPKEPPKAPAKAPFFLPTIAGVVPKFDVKKADESDKVHCYCILFHVFLVFYGHTKLLDLHMLSISHPHILECTIVHIAVKRRLRCMSDIFAKFDGVPCTRICF